MFSKKNKEEKEPQYYTSATNMPVLNYKVYYMSKMEKIMYFMLAFVVGAVVGYLFYGGLAKDEYGNATMTTYILDLIICFGVGGLAGKFFVPIRTKALQEKNVDKLRIQFRDMLDSLTTSLNAGMNVTDSFLNVYEDMKVQYDENAFIIKELEVIIAGIHNNIDIEDVLMDLGERSGIDDIKSFANVFKLSYRKGGNLKEIIRNTHSIISEKMEIEEDIKSMVSSNKMEQNMMTVMPVGIVGIIKLMSGDFGANFATGVGIVSTTIGIVIFIISYVLGKSILDIKV
ncbi:MAG: type II secretion system F family protein [Eubacterium sp.]